MYCVPITTRCPVSLEAEYVVLVFNGSGYSNPGTRVLEGKNTYSKPGFGPKNPGICKSGIFEAFFKLFLMKSTKKMVFIHLYISLKARAKIFWGGCVCCKTCLGFPPCFL